MINLLFGLERDLYPLLAECNHCKKVLPSKTSLCPQCGRPDPIGYEAKREFDFVKILGTYLKKFFLFYGYFRSPFSSLNKRT
jgi:predicted amidophosphoribosyltransferase